VNDLGKFAVIGAIMGALLLVGLLMMPAKVEEAPVPVAATPAPVVTVVESKTLELLDPIYSEKAVFQDSTIRVAFDVSQDSTGVETRLPFWLHNTSREVINVLWERCSIQLPEGNTVSVMSEEGLTNGTGAAISIASAGDLFDAMIPMSEMTWTETGFEFSYGVLDKGIFTVVLAIERAKPTEHVCITQPMGPAGCDAMGSMPGLALAEPCPVPCPKACEGGREVVYYTFRFVVR
jgi:hypothetical protein